jgi:GNAT superfamily N-acetyltransferase
MEISFKKIESVTETEHIKSLYLSAFPPEVRREYNELIKQIYFENCVVNLIYVNQKIAGFIILWSFNEFVFIEHFAIESGLRGQGIGEKVLEWIRKNFNKTGILETEPPLDEISSRRVNFYLRNGFYLLERHYLQPSYGGIKPEVEMKLMGTSTKISDKKLDEYIQQIREKVYHKFS